MSHLDEIRNMLTAFKFKQSDKTHLIELLVMLTTGLPELVETKEVKYEKGGVTAKIKFADGHQYSILIKVED